jgi:1,4-alpha-glucan branching enzyme
MKTEPLPTGLQAKTGAHLTNGGASFRIWAPDAKEVYLMWGNDNLDVKPDNNWKLIKDGEYFVGFLPGAKDGDYYRYWVVGPAGEGPKRDPRARELEWSGYPDCDCILRDPSSFPWAAKNYVAKAPYQLALYQLHVGTFVCNNESGADMRAVRVGRFLDVLDLFEHLVALNVTGIQLLPIVEWQSTRSLGYNGTDIYSPEMDYFVPESELARYVTLLNKLRAKLEVPPVDAAILKGGCHQLKALIDLFHLYDIAVFFDVVYNHLGGSFDAQSIHRIDFCGTENKPSGPYFQSAGWAGGCVLDYQPDEVRQFLVDNANAMIDEYRIDGIRYDEVTVIDDHGGWRFCQELTQSLAKAFPKALNIAEYWRNDKSWVVRDTTNGGAGFGAVWLDTLRDSIRDAIGAAGQGRSAFVNMTRVGQTLTPTFGDAENQFWRAVHYIENHDLHKAGNEDRKPRVAKLSDWNNSRSWYGRSRSRVANAMLLTAPGIPMIFMGQEILEDRFWSDNPGYFTDTLVGWQDLATQAERKQHLRFMQDLLKLRRERPGLTGRYAKAYQVHDIDRVLVLLRGTGNSEDDVVVVFSLNESTFYGYEIGLPARGTWYELLNSDTYDTDAGRGNADNGAAIDAFGPGRNTMPASAKITIPANGVLVLARKPAQDQPLDTEAKLEIYFQKPVNWASTVHIHYWNTAPLRKSTQWPGELMQPVASDWYKIELQGISACSIVFNDGQGRQTADLRRENKGWYLSNGTWSDVSPLRAPALDAHPRQPVYDSAVTVVLESTSPDDAIYYTLDGTTPNTTSARYGAPIELPLPATKSTTTIAAFGVNRDGVKGDLYEFSYTIDPDLDLRAPTIAAEPPAGNYPKTQKVVFTITDDRAAPVTAYMTTDGSEPTKSSPKYVSGSAVGGLVGSPLTVKSVTLVKLLVIDSAGNETRKSFAYTIGGIADFREETIYFLLTTRFYDGNPSLGFFCRDRIRLDANGNAIDPHWRGDFAGLIQRLDYIKDLGFTAIWITPPVENRSGLDYHGYHAYDWTRIDPRLESAGATYADLIREVHARGMKLIQDIVINHSCNYGIRGKVWIDRLPVKYYVPAGSSQGAINNGPYRGNLGNYTMQWREDNDNPVAPDWFKVAQASDPAGVGLFTDPKTGQKLPSPGYDPHRFFDTDPNSLDTTWYHQQGFMSGGDWENPTPVEQKHLAGDCMDLNTENEVVKRYLIDAIAYYLDMGVDALRIDTLKHMSRDNVLEYVNAWKATRPGLFIFGENMVKGTGFGDVFGDDNAPSALRPWWYTRLGNDPRDPKSGPYSGLSVLDFSLFSTFRDNLSRGHYGGIGGILARDWVYGDATQLVTFLQNHDVGPDNDFRFRFKGDQWMAAAAYNLLWTIRGIPCLYYGEEVEFQKGMPQDIGQSEKLFETGRAYFGDYLTPESIESTKGHPLFAHIRRLNLIRRNIVALQKGIMSQVNEWGGGIQFVRDYQNGQSYVVVGLAIGSDQNFNVSSVRNGTYRDAVTGREVLVTGGSLPFQVKANSAGIYLLDGPGKIGEEGLYLR